MATTRKKLTEKVVDALPPATERVQDYYWDQELRWFGVVVGRTGSKTFVTRTQGSGSKAKIGVLGQPRPDGQLWTARLARIAAGKQRFGDPEAVAKKLQGPTLRDGLELHVANMKAGKNRRKKVCSPRSIHKMETEVPRHLSDWLDRPLVELTALELQKVCDLIERNATAIAGAVNRPGVAQANKVIAHVSAIWNALDKSPGHPDGLPYKNPAERVQQSALAPRETRIPDDGFIGWFAKVMDDDPITGMNPVRRDLQLVSLFTGIRSEGVRNLQWDDIDDERELLQIRKAKGGKPYTLPLVETVRKILEKRRTENAREFERHGGDHGWCFPSLSRDQKRVQAVAEVKERRIDKTREDEDGNPLRVAHLPGIHANRRTFNSVAMEILIPLEARNTLMNHEGKGVNVKHYGVPERWDQVRECAKKIEAALWERLKPPTKTETTTKSNHLKLHQGGL